MTRGALATTIKTLLLRTRSNAITTPKGVVVRCMNKVAIWDECYYEDDDHEVQSFKHKVQPHKKHEESCLIPDQRTGIYYPKGHEWVMKDVPNGAATFDYTHWFRNGGD